MNIRTITAASVATISMFSVAFITMLNVTLFRLKSVGLTEKSTPEVTMREIAPYRAIGTPAWLDVLDVGQKAWLIVIIALCTLVVLAAFLFWGWVMRNQS